MLRALTEAPSAFEDDPARLTRDLVAALKDRKCVVFIDDWHWVDQATRLVLQDVVRDLQNAPVMIVLASRFASPDDGLMRASHQIHVPPMTVKEAHRCAERFLGQPINAQLRDEIFEKTGGLPLYLDELCYALERRGAQSDGEFTHGLSANLSALIASRIERLEEDELELLLAAAPHSDTVDPVLPSKVMGQEVQDDLLTRLCDKDILTPGLYGGAPRFKHGMTRDAAYNMIPPKKRRALHRAYLEALSSDAPPEEGDGVIEQLALHADRCGDIRAAIDFAERAGHKALAASSLDQALRQFSRAMELIDTLPANQELEQRWLKNAILWSRPSVYCATPDHTPILRRAQALAERMGEQGRLAEILYWTGYNLLVQGEYEEAKTCLRDSNTLAHQIGSDRLVAETVAILGCAAAFTCQYEEAEQLIEQAIGEKDKNPVHSGQAPVTSAYSRSILAMMRADQGAFTEAGALFDVALDRVAEFRHEIESSILNTVAAVHLWQGNWGQARMLARRSQERSERVSALYLIGISRSIFHYADWKLTGNTSNVDELISISRWMDSQGMRLFLTFIAGWVADACAGAGRWDECAMAARLAVLRSESGEGAGVAMALRAFAKVPETHRHDSDPDPLDCLQQARLWAERRTAPHEMAQCALAEARYWHGLGDHAAAARAAHEAATTFETLGLHEMAARLTICRTAPTPRKCPNWLRAGPAASAGLRDAVRPLRTGPQNTRSGWRCP